MDLTWKLAGACRMLSTDMFFPASDTEAGPAKSVCDACPVEEPCLEYALAAREPEGVWGGCTFSERRAILRRRRERQRKLALVSA